MATILGINFSEDCAVLKIRANQVYTSGKYYPDDYPQEKGYHVTRFMVHYHKEQPGLRKMDLLKLFPGDNIVIHLTGPTVNAIELEDRVTPLQKVVDYISTRFK